MCVGLCWTNRFSQHVLGYLISCDAWLSEAHDANSTLEDSSLFLIPESLYMPHICTAYDTKKMRKYNPTY